jgi:hypothetical protein
MAARGSRGEARRLRWGSLHEHCPPSPRAGRFPPPRRRRLLAGAGGEAVGSSSAAIDGSTIVSRGMEWVNADLHYCQAAHDDVDYDSSCWAWEGSSHRCDRESNAAWNAYRSDCSGFVTWAWGLPAVGDGGYVTSEFAPYDNSFSHTIDGSDLQPGDALNKTPDEHIILFKQWVSVGHSAVFMEEPGCSAPQPYAHEFTSDVSISGSEVYVDYEGATFYAIRYSGTTAGSGSSSSGGGREAAPRRPTPAARGTASAPRPCSAMAATGSSGRMIRRRARPSTTSTSPAAWAAATAPRRCNATAATGCPARTIRPRARRAPEPTEDEGGHGVLGCRTMRAVGHHRDAAATRGHRTGQALR